jgi:DNA-nicking Smr family endonuclease
VARTLDLHGKTAEQARERVRDFVLTTSRGASGRVVRFITGKGTGSAGQAVLRPHSAWPRPTPGSSDAWASWIRAGNAG